MRASPTVAGRTAVTGILAALVSLGASPARAESGTVSVPDGFRHDEIAAGVTDPTGFAFLPDGRLLVVEQKQPPPQDGKGFVYLVVGSDVVGPILVIPDVSTAGNEEGLLGVAVDPAWPDRPYVYVYYSRTSSVNVVRRYTASGDLMAPGSFALTLDEPYDVVADLPSSFEFHNGGTLRFGPDGFLYVSQGDDATDDCTELQDPSSWQGVVLRLDVSTLPGGSGGPPAKADLVPSGNPFTGPDDNARLTFALGFRNPFRFTIDPATGKLYVGDVGESDWEELDECVGGESFGWPLREGAHDFPPGAGCPGIAGVDPIVEYPHSGGPAAIIAGPRYRTGAEVYTFPAEYDGDVFYASFYEGWIRRLTEDGGEWVPADPVAGQPNATDWVTGLAFASDIQQGPDGAIYYVRRFAESFLGRIVAEPLVATDEAQVPGRHVRITVTPRPVTAGGVGRVTFEIAAPGHVEVAAFGVDGRRVVTLHDGPMDAGVHEVSWAADGMSPGVYFLRLVTPTGTVTARVPVVR